MSDELSKNYEIFELDHPKYKYLVLRRFCHSIQQQNQSVEREMAATGYQGWVLFDNLFKGGNTPLRFGVQFFDKTFSGPLLVEEVPLTSPIRVMVSRYLKENDFVVGTSLRQQDILDVMEGKTI